MAIGSHSKSVAIEEQDATQDIGRYATSFGISLGITSLFNALLVVVKETSEHSVLTWMKAATGHHWITHGLLDLLVFVVLGFALANYAGRWRYRPAIVLVSVVGGVVVGSLIIAGFFLRS